MISEKSLIVLPPVGYTGYYACITPYILFKLEEIKKSEAISL